MVRLLNKKDEILKKVDEIIDYIENSDNYKKYLIIKEKMNNDQEINDLINEVKHLQKRLANHYNKQLEIELEEKKRILERILIQIVKKKRLLKTLNFTKKIAEKNC